MSPRAPLTACLCACALSFPCNAAADPLVVKQMIHGFVAESPLQDRTFTATDSPAAHVRFTDGGTKIGGGARSTFVYRRMRGSIGFGAFGIRNAHAVTRTGNEVSSFNAGGGYAELAAGYEFRLGPLFPYADLRATFEFDSVSLVVRNPPCGEQLAALPAYAHLSAGPSVGVFVPFEPLLFVDLSGYMGWLGERNLGAFAGFGFWIPAE